MITDTRTYKIETNQTIPTFMDSHPTKLDGLRVFSNLQNPHLLYTFEF